MLATIRPTPEFVCTASAGAAVATARRLMADPTRARRTKVVAMWRTSLKSVEGDGSEDLVGGLAHRVPPGGIRRPGGHEERLAVDVDGGVAGRLPREGCAERTPHVGEGHEARALRGSRHHELDLERGPAEDRRGRRRAERERQVRRQPVEEPRGVTCPRDRAPAVLLEAGIDVDV